MPFNSTTGVYSAPSNTWNPAVYGTVIDPVAWNETQDDYVDAFNTLVSAQYNVKEFGAVCDGTTDDAAAINAALTRAGVVGGKVIIPGLSAVGSTITVPDGVWLCGISEESGLIAKDAMNSTLLSAGSNCIISDFSIDGNYTNQTGGRSGITMRTSSSDFFISRMKITNSYDSAISVNSGSTRGLIANNIIDGVFASGTGSSQGPGIDVSNGSGGGSTSNMLLVGNIVRNTDSGNIAAGAAINGFYVYNNVCDTTDPNGTSVHLGDNITAYNSANTNLAIVGNRCRNSKNNGIHVGGSNISITGNVLTLPVGQGILVASAPNGSPTLSYTATVSGNSLTNIGSHGIQIQNYTGFTISGNSIENAGTSLATCFGVYASNSSANGSINTNSVRTVNGSCIALNSGATDIAVNGNSASEATNHGVLIGINSTAVSNIVVTGNRITGNASRAIVEANSTTLNLISDNHVVGNGNTSEPILLLSTSGSRSVNNITDNQYSTLSISSGGSTDIGEQNDFVSISASVGALTITDFVPKWPGREIKLLFTGSNSIAVANSSPIFLDGTSFASNTASSDSSLILVTDGTSWFETSRNGETAATKRSALGLGTAATQNTGTSGANVPLLNGANTWSDTQTLSVAPVFTDQSGSRSALGLGTIATQAANNVAITGGSISGITDLAVADGGTGASTARGAVANLMSWYIVGASAVQQSVTGTVSETVLATVTIPAGAMGANGRLRITAMFSNNNSGNSKTFRVRWGASGAGTSGTAFNSVANTTSLSWRTIGEVDNRNAANSQVLSINGAGGGVGVGAGAFATTAIDTASASEIAFTAQLANTGDTANLDSYIVELFYAA